MSLIPENRHLLVIPIEEPISQNHDTVQLLMPDDFKPPQSLHVVCEVVSIAKDSKFYGEVVDRIVTERRMLQEIKIEGETYYLVLENYVYGSIENEVE